VDCHADGQEPSINGVLQHDQERARHLGRELRVHHLPHDSGPEIVQLALDEKYDLIVLPLPPDFQVTKPLAGADRMAYILGHAPCRVFLASPPSIPQEVEK
jgi:hypothetical protein